jgi:predicted unusual protein kinase regulating ubiquinone biosynthesis (AarF/ABC1/UbiB family)
VLDFLTRASVEQTFSAGDTIVADGAFAEGLFVVTRGTASVIKYAGSSVEIELARLHAGEHFGEMSLVSELPASASVVARSDVTCAFVSRERFDRLLREHPDMARTVLMAFVKTLAHRLTRVDRDYASIMRRERRREAIRHVVRLSVLYTRMFISYGWMYLRRPYSAEQKSRIHRDHARRYRELASTLKGAAVKMAQLASMQQALLPREYLDEFKQLRDKVTPSAFPLIAGSIQAELGAGPLEVFAEFERSPLASASMGQVHRAKLHTGEDVVVKVLHPGVERSVAIDLWLAKVVLRVMNVFTKPVDLMQIYRESEAPLHEELDLLHEADATEKLGRTLEPFGVRAPRVYRQCSSRRILTLEFIEGVRLNDVEQMDLWKVDRVELARTYLRAFFQQSLTHGYFHADPHASNGLCTRDGKLVMLDFGMVKRLPDHIRRGLTMEWMGGFFRNPRMYVDGLILKGAIGEEDRAVVEEAAVTFFNDPRMRDMAFGRELQDDAVFSDFLGDAATLMSKLKTFKTPQDELMFIRGLGIAFDTAREIVPEMKLMELAEPIYAEVFQRVLLEHPEYASGPFRFTLRDVDVSRLLSRWMATKGFRDVTVVFENSLIRARASFPFAGYDVNVALSAAFVAFDVDGQALVLDLTTFDIADFKVLQPMLPFRLNVKLETLGKLTGSRLGDVRVDELTIADGAIMLARHPS